MERSARFVAAPLLRHLAAAELSENRDQLFVAVEPIDTYAVVGVGVFRDTSDDVAQRQPDNYAYGNAPHHDASPPIKQTFAPPDQTNSTRPTHHGARGPQVAGVTKQTQRRWIDFAEIWVSIPIALTNCCANYSIISKVKMVY